MLGRLVRLARMNGSIRMLGRTVERVETQRRIARVPDVVARTRGHDDGEIVLDRVLSSIDVDEERSVPALPFLQLRATADTRHSFLQSCACTVVLVSS